MTNEQIKLMTAPQLRKSVRNAGKDPMSGEFDSGDPERMREFLYKLFGPERLPAPPVAAPITPPTVVTPTYAEKPHAPTVPMATVQPVPMLPSVAPSTATVVLRQAVPTPVSASTFALKSEFEALILRVNTLEQALKVSNSTPVTAEKQTDKYAILSQYLQDTPDGPELVLTVSQVPALTLEQKLLVLQLFGEPADVSIPPRILNQRIITALQKTKTQAK